MTQASSFSAKFRYSGADLDLMKRIAGTTDPYMAVEAFIERAIRDGKDPNTLLEEVKKEQYNAS